MSAAAAAGLIVPLSAAPGGSGDRAVTQRAPPAPPALLGLGAGCGEGNVGTPGVTVPGPPPVGPYRSVTSRCVSQGQRPGGSSQSQHHAARHSGRRSGVLLRLAHHPVQADTL